MRKKKLKKRTKKQNGKYSRRKGHQFERDIANQLKDIFPEARRQLEYHSADANGVDIQNTESFFFQCKKYKSYVPCTKINEIRCDRSLGEVPILVTAGDNLEPLAVLPFKDLLNLIREATA